MKISLLLALTLAILIAPFFVSRSAFSRGGYESASYEVILEDDRAEVRRYKNLTLVGTAMGDATSKKATDRKKQKTGDDGFMKLFGYISGKNEESQKIAMTTPVLIDARDPSAVTMNFVLPSTVASEGAPRPSADSVKLNKMSGGAFAALRFKGYRDREAELKAVAELRAWAAERGLETDGGPFFAYYDPPWTPGFMRRNEVLLRIKSL